MPEGNGRPTYMGIDPGASGCIIALTERGAVWHIVDMMDNYSDLWYEIDGLTSQSCHAVIEEVSGYVGKEQPGSAMFKFGQNYGALLMALTAARISHESVRPQTWQKAMGIPPRKKAVRKSPDGEPEGEKETKGQFKRRLKAKAQQLFPKTKVTLTNCDALLLAEYCRRMHLGILRTKE